MAERPQQATVLGCRLDLVDMDDAVRWVERMIEKRIPSQVVTLNAEMIVSAQEKPYLKRIFTEAGLVTPDGIGSVWALRRLGYSVSRRVTGVGLTFRLLDLAGTRGMSIYLLGAKPGIVDELEEILKNRPHPVKVAGSHHGYFAEEDVPVIVASIKDAAPDILLVGMGAPKQDEWIAEHLHDLEVPVCIGVGGTFDVLAGKVKRAPRIWRQMGLEWFYRLVSEPSRIKRQMALPRFVWMILTRSQR